MMGILWRGIKATQAPVLWAALIGWIVCAIMLVILTILYFVNGRNALGTICLVGMVMGTISICCSLRLLYRRQKFFEEMHPPTEIQK